MWSSLSDSIERKFVDSIDISDQGWEIESNDGFNPLTHINKTIKYITYRIVFESGIAVECADDHIFISKDGNEVFAKDSLGIDILSKSGIDTVISVIDTNTEDHMYDVSVGSASHTYYSNDILSHNSTTFAAFLCWYVIFNKSRTAIMVANKAATSREIFSRFQLAYENIPFFLQKGVKEWNKTSIELENGSKAKCVATSASSIRGSSPNLLYIDEYAHVSNAMAEDFFTSVFPALSAGKENKLIFTSTPKGYNHYHKLWSDAISGKNGYFPIHVTWDEHPERDEQWKIKELASLGEEKFAQEHLTEFLGSSNTLIRTQYLKTLVSQNPIYDKDGLTIYEHSNPEHQYIITCDVARGTGNDYSAYVVVDITTYPFKVVAKYRDNQISTQVLPTYLYKTGQAYNNALILIETNDNGQQVADILFYDLEYEETIFMFGNRQPGCRTTKASKRLGCSIFKDMIESQKLLIPDSDIISEITTFIKQPNDKGYAAESGSHDDLIMCLIILAYFTTKDEFKMNSDLSLRQELITQNQKNIEEDLLPFGIIDDGLSDDNDDSYMFI